MFDEFWNSTVLCLCCVFRDIIWLWLWRSIWQTLAWRRLWRIAIGGEWGGWGVGIVGIGHTDNAFLPCQLPDGPSKNPCIGLLYLYISSKWPSITLQVWWNSRERVRLSSLTLWFQWNSTKAKVSSDQEVKERERRNDLIDEKGTRQGQR